MFACGSMVAAALVLLSTGKSYVPAAVTQGVSPSIAVIASLIAK